MTHDTRPADTLQKVVALESLHHAWYFETKDVTNHVRYVEWLLERTTCIQKAMGKWLAPYPPRTALLWGHRHAEEEMWLLESDLNDIVREMMGFRPTDERMLPNGPPARTVSDLVQQMIQTSTEIRENMRRWGSENMGDPAASTMVDVFTHTCAIQMGVLREVQNNPTDIRAALRAAYPGANASAAALREVLKRVV